MFTRHWFIKKMFDAMQKYGYSFTLTEIKQTVRNWERIQREDREGKYGF